MVTKGPYLARCVSNDGGYEDKLTVGKIYSIEEYPYSGNILADFKSDLGQNSSAYVSRFVPVPEAPAAAAKVRVLTLDIPLNAKQVVVTVSEAGASWQWDCAE